MQSNIGRHYALFIVNHWLLAFLIITSLGLGWYMANSFETDIETREFIRGLHTSLGMTAAIVLLIQFVFQAAFKPLPYPANFPKRLKLVASSSHWLINVSLVLLLASGYLEAVFNGTPVEFWGVRMPDWNVANQPVAELFGRFWGAPLRIWGAANVTSAKFFGSAHSLMAYILVGAIFVHVGGLTINRFRWRAMPAAPMPTAPMVAASAPLPDAPETPRPTLTSNAAQGLAKTLRLFGWIEFGVQLVFVLFTALLLEFATSGRAFSPGSAGFGDPIYWGIDGFILLLAAVLLAFYYTRAARHIAAKPDVYLSKRGVFVFWFLMAGLLTGFLGVLISFTGVALSISLLIAKTVSQPPGIAITDPTKIIRAIDVFILLVNYILLMAHCIGAGIAAWLSLNVTSARLKYITTEQ